MVLIKLSVGISCDVTLALNNGVNGSHDLLTMFKNMYQFSTQALC